VAVDAQVPTPPADLVDAPRELWEAVVSDWELRPDELPLLTAACRTLAEIETIESALIGASALVPGSKGQDRANPLFAEVRAHRLALRQLLGSLGIEEAEDEEGGGSGSARSNAGRKLAAQRWRRNG
jgi:hypothetical protein